MSPIEQELIVALRICVAVLATEAPPTSVAYQEALARAIKALEAVGVDVE